MTYRSAALAAALPLPLGTFAPAVAEPAQGTFSIPAVVGGANHQPDVALTPANLAGHACPGFTGYAAWPDWPLRKGGRRQSVRPDCTLVADHSEVLLAAAVKGADITFTAD